MKHELVLEGLNCAHCAAKIEDKLIHTPEYSDVSFSFATKALSLNCDRRNIISDVQQIVDSIEDGVTVRPAEETAHDESDEEPTGKVKLILLIVAAALFAAAFVMHFFEGLTIPSIAAAVIAVGLSGYDVVVKGVRSVFKGQIDETTLMTVAVVAAMILGVVNRSSDEFVEAAAVTVLFGVGELLEDKAVEKSRRDIRRLADIRPDTAIVLIDGCEYERPAKEVAVGEELLIAPHARIPLDGVVIEGSSTIDASSLTGESAPIDATVGTELMSGMLNNDRQLKMRVTKPYADSAATRIVRLVEESAKNKGTSEKLITRFARIYTPVMMVLALLIAIVPPLFLGDFALWIRRALVCLVAACPCSIVISVPLSYFAGIGAASRAGVLIKGGRFVEALGKARVMAFDKTGTLTDNNISVKEIESTSNYSLEELLSLAASVERNSAHPIAAAIRAEASRRNISLLELKNITEIPGKGVSAQYGDRIVACGKSDGGAVTLTVNGSPVGTVTLEEHIRDEAPSVLKALKGLGIRRLMMLTGDRRESAEAIGNRLGLDSIHSELLPEDKVACVDDAISTYGSCAFIGDGINDAPVLSRSGCGIAMGLSSDAAIESADVVLSSGTLESLPRAVRIARSTVNTAKANIIFSLVIKAAIIALAALGFAPMWLAVFADTGVCVLCVLNATRLIKSKHIAR